MGDDEDDYEDVNVMEVVMYEEDRLDDEHDD